MDKNNSSNEKYNKPQKGDIGENFVLYQLARHKIAAVKLPPKFDYDIITDNDARIEVKTATIIKGKKKYKDKIYSWDKWTFANHRQQFFGMRGGEKEVRLSSYKISNRDRKCDFFILVCLDENLDVCKCYIVPKVAVGERRLLTIYTSGKSSFEEYLERWDLIEKFNHI